MVEFVNKISESSCRFYDFIESVVKIRVHTSIIQTRGIVFIVLII